MMSLKSSVEWSRENQLREVLLSDPLCGVYPEFGIHLLAQDARVFWHPEPVCAPGGRTQESLDLLAQACLL
jgi:hypothetical protein